MSLLGEMDERITFQRRTRAADGAGGFAIEAWTDIGTCWAKVTGQRMGEGERHDAMREAFTYLFKVPTPMARELALTADDRIVWRGGEFNIREVRTVPRRIAFTDITAESGVTQ